MDELTIKDRKTFKVVHVSDPHVDYLYAPGSDAQCNDYLCCRANQGFPTEKERQAGRWGSYQCDTPPETLEKMFQYIAEVVKPDVLIWTGDNSPHVIWENDFKEVVSATTNITNMIKNAFKNTKVTVIAAQGNHDSFPANNQEFT
jgi:sphingomyelin phosphodiesterase